MLDKIAVALTIIGAINWGSIGLFKFDIVSAVFGAESMVTRVIFTLVGIAGLWAISVLFKRIGESHE